MASYVSSVVLPSSSTRHTGRPPGIQVDAHPATLRVGPGEPLAVRVVVVSDVAGGRDDAHHLTSVVVREARLDAVSIPQQQRLPEVIELLDRESRAKRVGDGDEVASVVVVDAPAIAQGIGERHLVARRVVVEADDATSRILDTREPAPAAVSEAPRAAEWISHRLAIATVRVGEARRIAECIGDLADVAPLVVDQMHAVAERIGQRRLMGGRLADVGESTRACAGGRRARA